MLFRSKEKFSPENALKENHKLEKISVKDTLLPSDAILYIADNKSIEPWWKSYWGINKKLFQTQKGAVIFIPIENRWFALTFGMTHHKLKDVCFEYDFELRTTLNVLDSEKVKSTDILVPENAKRQRIQIPKANSLNYFDIKQNESIIKKLTGDRKSVV